MTALPVERVNGTPLPAEPRFEYDPVAHAQAEAIRTRAEADAEALRIAAEGKAEAEKTKAGEEARKLKIANDKAEARAREEQAAREARIAKLQQEKAAAERAEREAADEARRERAAEQEAQKKVNAAEDSWRVFAVAFAIVCGVVALPVQMAAFWNKQAPWMISAPFMLEGAAWVVLRGAAAAVAARRPHWHFRLIAWLLAFVAAGVNLWHGLIAFDPATAIGTAVASIAGPGVWDLYEHGRIRRRDGVLTRRERKAAEKAAKAEVAQKAVDEKRRAAEKEAADEAAREERQQLAERRAKQFPKVWEHAEKLATDLGETEVTQAIWERAKLDVEGAKPGESAEVLRMRNAAELRVAAARQQKPVSTLSKTTNAQRASQVPGAKKPRVYNPPARPGKRAKGDVKYVAAARKQASLAAKSARPSND